MAERSLVETDNCGAGLPSKVVSTAPGESPSLTEREPDPPEREVPFLECCVA
jgi:hypothetical protein